MESNLQSYGLGPKQIECAGAHFHSVRTVRTVHTVRMRLGAFRTQAAGAFFSHLNSSPVRNLDEASVNSTLVYGVSTPVMPCLSLTMVFRVKDVTEGVLCLNPPRRAVLEQSPVINELGPLIVAIILIGGVKMAWSSSI